MNRKVLQVALLLLSIQIAAQVKPEFAIHAGEAEASVNGAAAEIHNEAISAKWDIGAHGLSLVSVSDKLAGRRIAIDREAFVLLTRDGQTIKASQLEVVSPAKVTAFSANPGASRLAEHFPGKQITAEFDDRSRGLQITWRAILRDGSNYLRQEVTIHAEGREQAISEVHLLSVSAAGAHVVGSVKGSPVVEGTDFLAFEHPLSTCSPNNASIVCSLKRELPLRAGRQVTYSSVIGVTRPKQLRRDFLAYIERERAHPYRTFLHYNTWYDLGYFGRFDQAGVLDRIHAFGEELIRKRGVKMDSLLLDDGWDDPNDLWRFNSGFPQGFTPVRAGAAEYDIAPGVWLSPWGGYGQPKQQRLQSAQKLGLETYKGGLALSGPKYFDYFRKVCLEMIERFGVNQFKFDGTGNADRVIPNSEFDSDFDAAITLISELRAHKPDLYVNLTTGTYPSPFWLRYADSIWRGGEDHDFAGVGTARQRWITYRDADTYQHVVQAGPLFRLSSLMLHGIIYAQYAKDLNSDPGNDFADEVHSYFGTGTQLQEMYITPSLLNQANWDTLAAAAKWSRQNADTLRDTHWIGGDPGQLQVYGWAAWSPEKGIITLRNPADREQSFVVDVGTLLEIPEAGQQKFRMHSMVGSFSGGELTSGQPQAIQLKPFEVLTLEALPGQ